MSADNEGVSTINIDKYSVVLLDVAGTLTSISFVKDTLFPYVCGQAEEYLKANWEETEVKDAVKKLQTGDDVLDVTAATNLVKESTEKNSTNEGLKIIQGLISKKGYESGDIKAHIFDEVPSVFELLSKNKRIAIYSTGSVDSQKLFFGHTTKGDLTSHISKYFDQAVGSKTESSSYEKIAKELEVPPEEVVFITDLAEEAKAAKTAGVVPFLIKREGNDPLPEDLKGEYTVIASLNELTTENVSKRKIDETDNSEVPPTKVAKTEETDIKTPVENDKKPAEDVPQQPEVEPMEVDEVDVPEESPGEVADKSPTEKLKTDDKESENDKTDGKEDSNKDTAEVKNTEESKPVVENAKIEETSNEKDKKEETVNGDGKIEDKTEEVVDKKDETEETVKENNKTEEATNENKVEESTKVETTTNNCDEIEGPPKKENTETKETTNECKVDQTADTKTIEDTKEDPEKVDNGTEKAAVSEEKKECDKVDITNSKVVKETCDKVVKEAEIVDKCQQEKTEPNEISSTSTANECDKVDKTATPEVPDKTAQNNTADSKVDDTNEKPEETTKVDEKENTLTNGNETANGDKTVATNGDSEENPAEIKVKQLETKPESTPVSVEV